MYGEGISSAGELVDLAVSYDLITKSGSWYGYGDVRMGQGREQAKRWLVDNPEDYEVIKSAVRTKLGLKDPAANLEA